MWKSVVSHRRRYRPSIRPSVKSLLSETFNAKFGTSVAIHHTCTCRTVFATERFTGPLEVVLLRRGWVDLKCGSNQSY